MSGWPWMKHVKGPPIADPIEPAEEHDHRLSIPSLITDYRVEIDQVREQLQDDPLYDASKHDDLWILRFLLSHKRDVERAVEAAKATLVFRNEHCLDDTDIRPFPPQHVDKVDNPGFKRFMKAGRIGPEVLTLVVEPKKIILYLDIVAIDIHGLSEVSQEDWLEGMIYIDEWAFQWLDYLTRTTGRLTKSIRIADIEGINLFMQDPTTRERYTFAQRAMQDFYPQALQLVLVCHAPSWIQIPWWVLRPLFPQRVVEKVDFINPTEGYKAEEDRERLLSLVDEDVLPERFGGKYTTWPVDLPLPSCE